MSAQTSDANSHDCNQILPKGAVEQTIHFHKVFSFEYEIDWHDYLNEDDDPNLLFPPFVEKLDEYPDLTIRQALRVKFGLPLTFIDQGIGQWMSQRVVNVSRKNQVSALVSADKIVLPGVNSAPKKDMKSILIESHSLKAILEKGQLKLSGKIYQFSEKAKKNLLNKGKAFATYGKNKTLIEVKVKPNDQSHPEKSELRKYDKSDVNLKSVFAYSSLKEPTASKSFTKLKAMRELKLLSKRIRSGRSNTSLYMHLPGVFHPSKLSNEQYTLMLRILLSRPEAGELYIPGLQANSSTNENFNESAYQEALAAYKNDRRFERIYAQLKASSKPARKKSLPQYQLGLYATLKQHWRLLDYKRGALLTTIPLAPKEKVNVEIFKWEKKRLEQEEVFSSEYEKNIKLSNHASVSSTIGVDLADSLSSNAGLNGGASIPIDAVSLDLGADVGIDSQVDNNLKSTVTSIQDATVTTSERYKATHQLKVIQTHEYGTEERTIRTIENPNLSRSLTLNYFQVIERHEVETKVDQLDQWCLLIQNPDLGEFNIDLVLQYEDRLQQSLLSANYKSGFDAAKILAAQRWFDHQSQLKADLEEEGKLKQLDTANNAQAPSYTLPKKGVFASAFKIATMLDDFLSLDIEHCLEVIANNLSPMTPSPSIEQVTEAENDLRLFAFWTKLKHVYPGFESKSKEYVETIYDIGDTFNSSEELEEAKDAVALALSTLCDGFGEGWVYHVKMVAVAVVMSAVAVFALSPMVFILFGGVLVPAITPLFLMDQSNGLPESFDEAIKQLKKYKARQEGQVLAPIPQSPAASLELAEKTLVNQVPQLHSMQELAYAHADFQKLSSHLEANKVYYHNQIWRFENPEQRYERFKLMGVARFIDNKIIGFKGNKAVFPLRFDVLPEATKASLTNEVEGVDKLGDYQSIKEVTLPTSGIHLETVLGQCNALEDELIAERNLSLSQHEAQVDFAKAEARQAENEDLRQQALLNSNPAVLTNWHGVKDDGQ